LIGMILTKYKLFIHFDSCFYYFNALKKITLFILEWLLENKAFLYKN
jgi:hypothetical protein